MNHLQAKRDRIADAYDTLCLFPAFRADIHPHFANLGLGAALFGFHHVNRLSPDYAVDGTVLSVYDDARSGQHRRVDPTDRPEEDEAVVVDVVDHQGDLVAVAGEHDPR